MSRRFAFTLLMLLPYTTVAFAHSGSDAASAVATTQARPADMREDGGSQRREISTAERKPGVAGGRHSRAPQRWHGFLPGMFR